MPGQTKRQQTGRKIREAAAKKRPDIIKKLEEVFALDGTIAEACFYANITPATYHIWVNADPKLFDRFEALRNRPVLLARQTVVKSLVTNPDMALRYLERKKRAEFALRVENTGKDGAEQPRPILFYAVSSNNSDQKGDGDDKKDQGSTGGNISQQNSINSPILDSLSSVGQIIDVDQHSQRDPAAPQTRGNA